jgi:hypothetical protein
MHVTTNQVISKHTAFDSLCERFVRLLNVYLHINYQGGKNTPAWLLLVSSEPSRSNGSSLVTCCSGRFSYDGE